MTKKAKRNLVFGMMFIGMFILLSPVVLAESINYSNICGDSNFLSAIRIAGVCIQVMRWIVPSIIIILGMVDFGKAVTSSDEKAISKATGALVKRMIAGIAVFLIPTILLAILNASELIRTKGNANEVSGVTGCIHCLLEPDKC